MTLPGVTFEGETPFGPHLSIKRWRLDNGLTLLGLRDTAAPVVSYHTWFDVGSRHERAGERGMAHFFEHLMFLGTERNPFGLFDRKLEEVGAESNAATWLDFTSYHENLPAAELPLVVELESDRLAHLDVSPEQIDSEREVVLSEYRDRLVDDVLGRARAELYRLAFPNHPYGHPTLGVPEDLRAAGKAEVQAFHRRFYHAANTTLVVVGDYEEEALLGLVAGAYGHLPSRPRAELAIEPEAPRTGARRETLRLATATPKLLVGFPSPSYRDASAFLALELLDEVLFDHRTGRVSHRLREIDELATWSSAFVGPFRDPSLFELGFELREGVGAAEVEAVLDEEFARVRAELVPVDELARAKARYELHLLTELESAHGKAERIGFDHIVLDDPAAGYSRLETLRATTPEDLRDAARVTLDPAQVTVVLVLPNGEVPRDEDDDAEDEEEFA